MKLKTVKSNQSMDTKLKNAELNQLTGMKLKTVKSNKMNVEELTHKIQERRRRMSKQNRQQGSNGTARTRENPNLNAESKSCINTIESSSQLDLQFIRIFPD